MSSSTSGSVRHGTRTNAGARRSCRAPMRSTSDRVTIAWNHARPLARHLMVAACATSVALELPVRSSAAVACATAAVGVLLAAAALVDIHERRLPNQLLTAALAVALVGATLSTEVIVVRSALLGMIIAGALMLLVRVTRGVGMGDVKMAAVVGASVSASTTTLVAAPIAIAAAAFAAAMYGFITSRPRVALGPSLWVGWASALVLVTALPSNGWLS
ncbi:MAG: prepilin peptidase [Ilumatobacteraceae bacterium]